MSEIALIYATAPDRKVAESIARALVEEQLAACVNILGEIASIYRWQGAVESAQEVAMLVKTSTQRAAAVIARIDALHPYECPAILHLPVNGGFTPFLAWVGKESST